MKDFRNLHVWDKAHRLTLEIYRSTGTFPRCELYGLSSQLRRSAASIGANIAEGCGKQGNAEFQRFLGIAAASASELDYHLLLARDLNFLVQEDYLRLQKDLQELRRMLTSLLKKVNTERLLAKC